MTRPNNILNRVAHRVVVENAAAGTIRKPPRQAQLDAAAHNDSRAHGRPKRAAVEQCLDAEQRALDRHAAGQTPQDSTKPPPPEVVVE